MQFIKEYVLRHESDNQILIRCPVGTKITRAKKVMNSIKVSTAVPVTKNQGCNITMNVATFEEYVGSLKELGISED